MREMLKWSRASWVVMAALTMETPLWKTTTARPSIRPRTNATPLMRQGCGSLIMARRATDSGSKAVITAVTGVLSAGPQASLIAAAAGVADRAARTAAAQPLRRPLILLCAMPVSPSPDR